LIQEHLAQTWWLNLTALLLVYLLGFILALASLLRPESWVSKLIEQITILLVSLPSVFLGPLLIWIFALQLGWLPTAFLDSPKHFILPVLTLSLRPAAQLSRILMRSLWEASLADYMRTAKAKGLSRWQALTRHALRNALTPILAQSGNLIVNLLSGSLFVEILFATKGVGVLFAESLSHRDLPVLMALTFFSGALLLFLNVMLDLIARQLDPRMRESS
jgi:oligopeptide transport system permease protein